jgi:DNA-binding beta-propeller fold protein YncE
MDVIMGSGDWRYRVETDWPRLPAEVELGDVSAVAVDRRDRVYLFNRGPNPMIVVDAAGDLVETWGQKTFTGAHGVTIGADDLLYCTDWDDHTVRKCTMSGEVLMQLGEPHRPAPYMSGRPFNRCTGVALSPDLAYLYVTDGYGNARVHKYAADGRLVASWGESGCEPGQFNLPHAICCDRNGLLYVADRENHRIQVFDGNGKYQGQINNLHRPGGLWLSGGAEPVFYVGELGPYLGFNRHAPNLGPRVTVMTMAGEPIARVAGDPPAGNAPGQFLSTHSVAVDSAGNLYVGQVGMMSWKQLFPDQPIPHDLCRIRKLVRLPPAARGIAADPRTGEQPS